MRNVILIDNSILGQFELDISKLYQPHKYQLHLITNSKIITKIKTNNHLQYFNKTATLCDFSEKNICKTILNDFNMPFSDNIITSSEETIPLCGRIRKEFDIDSYDYARFYNKHAMKIALKKSTTIKIPQYVVFDPKQHQANPSTYLTNLVCQLSFPLFTKPIAQYSSLNLKKIHSMQELLKWANTIKQPLLYEIDEFVDGTMYHCDSFIKNGKALFTLVSQNSRPCYDFTCGKIKGTIALPPQHPDAIQLSQITEKILDELPCPQGGVTHLELFKTISGDIYFVEIAHRHPGCLIPKMYQTTAQLDILHAHLLLQIDPEFIPKPTYSTHAAWLCYPKIPGRITQLNSTPKHIQSQTELVWHTQKNTVITSYSQHGRDYLGTVFMQNPCWETLYKEFLLLNNINLCTIKGVKAIEKRYIND